MNIPGSSSPNIQRRGRGRPLKSTPYEIEDPVRGQSRADGFRFFGWKKITNSAGSIRLYQSWSHPDVYLVAAQNNRVQVRAWNQRKRSVAAGKGVR